MADQNGNHALADTNTYMRISIYSYEYPKVHTTQTRIFNHTRTHMYIFAPKCVCYINSFTVKHRKYSINSSIKSLAIRDQHYANLIGKIWQNIKTNKTDMHICTRDRRYATATELLLLVVPGAVVLTAPSTVISICRSVDIDKFRAFGRLYISICPMHPGQEGRH